MEILVDIRKTELTLESLAIPGLQTWWEYKMLQINYNNGFYIPEVYFEILVSLVARLLEKIDQN